MADELPAATPTAPASCTTTMDDNRIASRPPFDNSNPITSPASRFKPSLAPTGGRFHRINRNQNKTYTEIQLSRQMAMRELSEQEKSRKLARRPFLKDPSTKGHKTQSLQKLCNSRGDFVKSIPEENEAEEDNLEILFQSRSHFQSAKNIENKSSTECGCSSGEMGRQDVGEDHSSTLLMNRRSASEGEGINPSSSFRNYKTPLHESTPKVASASNTHTSNTTSNPRAEGIRNRLLAKKNAHLTKKRKVDVDMDAVGDSGNTKVKEVVPVSELVEYIKISRSSMIDEESQDDDSESVNDCQCRITSANPLGDEVIELEVQHFDDVESEPEISQSPPIVEDAISVPSTLILMEDPDGKNFTGRLELDNRTNFYYAFVLKTNLAGKNGYFATPGQGSIPPKCKREVKISTTEAGYTQLLAKHDRLIMAGVGLPRRVKNSYLSRYLKAMLEKYPSVGEKKVVRPILKENPDEKAPPEKVFKNKQQIYLNRLICEISATHGVLRDVATKVRSHNAKENFLLLVMVIGMILVFVYQNQVLTGLVRPNSARMDKMEIDSKSNNFLSKFLSL